MGMPSMGEGNSGSNKTRYNILYGSFRRRVEEGVEGAISRKLEKGKNAGTLVWELAFTNYAGYITKVQLHESDFGTDIAIDFAPEPKGTSDATIYIPLYSSQGRSFLNAMLNGTPTEATRFTLWRKNEESRTMMFMAQWGGEKWEDVDRKYNVWNDAESYLEGLPKPIEGTKNGKPDWDYTAHTAALTDEFQKTVLPLIQKEGFLYDPKEQDNSTPAAKAPATAPAMGGGVDDLDDDLPF